MYADATTLAVRGDGEAAALGVRVFAAVVPAVSEFVAARTPRPSSRSRAATAASASTLGVREVVDGAASASASVVGAGTGTVGWSMVGSTLVRSGRSAR